MALQAAAANPAALRAAQGSPFGLPHMQHRVQPMLRVPHASKAANNSFDADEELDTDLAEELSRFRTPDTWNKVAQHLDLAWSIGRGRGKRSMCGCCQGTGEEECSWCHGTGALMVGDTLFRSADGGSHCPVCKGKGYTPCENCRGTGYRASWMQGPDQCKNPV